jgi:hypothetical protein
VLVSASEAAMERWPPQLVPGAEVPERWRLTLGCWPKNDMIPPPEV